MALAKTGDPWKHGAGKLVPRDGVDVTANGSKRRLKVLAGERGDELTTSLNNHLLGHNGYPLANSVASFLMGVVFSPAGTLQSLVTATMSQMQTTPRVLARQGDEMWQVEVVGKVGREVMHAEFRTGAPAVH